MTRSPRHAIVERPLARRIAVFLIVVVVFGLSMSGGPVQSPDTTLYISLADAIRAGRIDAYITPERATWTVVTFPSLVALARTVAPARWELLILLVNLICSGVTAVLLVDLTWLVTRSVAASVAALLFYLTAFDIVSWARFILTDTVYASLALVSFFLVAKGIVREGSARRRRAGLAVSLLACCVTRPTGIALVPPALLTEFLFVPRAHAVGVRRRRAEAWLVIVSGILALVVVRVYVLQDVQRWPFEFMRSTLAELAARESRGEVVWGRVGTFRRPPETVQDHLVIQADRFVRFFQVTCSEFSPRHNVINVVYYGSLFSIGLIGVVHGLRSGGRRRLVVQAALLWIVGTAGFSALTVLDYDWRYRLPVMPQFILLAACGVDFLVEWRRRARSAGTLYPDQPESPELFSD